MGLELWLLGLQLCLIQVRGTTNSYFVNVHVNVTYRAGGWPVAMQRARVVGQRSCYGNYGKLVRKVGNTVTFPIYIMPKNQSLSFDQEFTMEHTVPRMRVRGCPVMRWRARVGFRGGGRPSSGPELDPVSTPK